MKNNSLTIKALTFLLKAGLVYKSDLSLLIYADSSTANSTKTISSLIKQNYLNTKQVNNDNPKGYEDVVELTALGRDKIVELLDDNYWKIHKIDPIKKFKSNDQKTILDRLDENSIALMFKVANAAVFKDEKPSIERLLLDGVLKDKHYPVDFKTNKEITRILDEGIYYTRDEYFNYLKTIAQFESNFRTIKRSKFKGIYINSKNIFVVYSTKRSDSKLIRTNYYIEELLFNSLSIFEHCNSKEPSALFISSSSSLAAAMVIGVDNGLYKKNNYDSYIKDKFLEMSKRQRQNPNKEKLRKLYKKKMIFDVYLGIYKHMFVVTRDYAGTRSIKYLCHNTYETWINESRELFETNPKYFVKKSVPPIEYAEIVGKEYIPSIYVPVIDVNELSNLAKQPYASTIVAYEDMIEVIAKCIRKEITFYDADFYIDGQRTVARKFINNPTFIYDQTGYPKGVHILKQLIGSINKIEANKNVYSQLNKSFGYESQKAFYNDIARGVLEAEEVIKNIKVKDKVKTKNNGTLTFRISNELYNMAKVLAENENMSVSQYLTKLTIQIVDVDYEEYKKNLREAKRRWKELG